MDSILMGTEVDAYIDSMKCSKIEDIGQKYWLEWHSRLSKLNQQAILEAAELKEESVKEGLISAGKIPVLVHEAICISIWKKKILPHILKYETNPSNTFTIYSVFYHEAVSVSLLETVLFHSNSCEALGDSALDLFEYCVDTVTQILGYTHTEMKINEHIRAELERQQKELEFDIGIRAISILRYFAEYLDSLPLSITSKMFSSLDVPLLFCELINCTPWARIDEKGNTLKFQGGRWQKVENIKLNPTEAQVWIGLRQLLLDPKCLSHYTLNDFRKDQFIKLQKYLHENTLDQLSPLIDLKHWICQLASCSLPVSNKAPVLLEVLPQIKQGILNRGKNKWKEIARTQVQIFFKQDHDDLVEMAQRFYGLSDAYDTSVLEKLENINLQVCSGCGGNAIKKCSRCKNEWYCSRNCQVKHWPQHKEQCDLIAGVN